MSPCPTLHRALAAAVGCALLAGCAQERPPVNRVQPNYTDKTFFVGNLADPSDNPEFYMRTTVTDVQSGAGSDGLFTNTWAQPMVRVRFELTETMLLARLTYELIQDTDYKGARRTPNGQIVAAYAVQSHFDIKRSYNTTTGEELNVLEENTTDRPWYERQYVRVDWSKNLVTDAYDLDTLSQIGLFGAVKFDPVAYYVSDPASPDAPVFDYQNSYFDISTKVLASPQIIHDPEWGDYPACWLYGQYPATSCNPSELTLRQSFRKVVDTDYEPLDYDGTRMDIFGYFTSDRFGYDRRYGIVDDKWHRFATRWNLWQQSHVADARCASPETTPVGKSPHRDENKDGTEDECAAVGQGSRCDEFRGECTLPFRQRSVKTIPWYVNADFPEDLFAGTAESLQAWNSAMRVSVIAARLSECRRTGGKTCEAQLGWPQPWSDNFVPPVGSSSLAEVPNIFVLCHNPVDSAKGDDPACGADGTVARLGDLRYSMVSVITPPQEQSPWGIMVDAEDPLTGEKIAGSVNEWAAPLDRASSNVADLVQLLNGTIAPDEFIVGQNVSQWVEANKPGAGQRPSALSAAELASRKGAYDPASLAALHAGLPKGKPHEPKAALIKARSQALVDQRLLGPGNAALSASMAKLRGTPLEASLISPELAQAARMNPNASLSAEQIKRASPFERFNPRAIKEKRLSSLSGYAHRHSCRREALEPDNLTGLAAQAIQLFGKPDKNNPQAVNDYRKKLLAWLRQEFSKGVLAHEMGHAMGLRHNFAASFDSFNYEPQYWQLRTRNGAVTAQCADGNQDGAACIGPRWKDPVTPEELNNGINRYATTSVMDYPGEQTQDMNLPGKYDRAALRFGYAGTVDVFDKAGVSVTNGTAAGKAEAYKLTAFDSNPGLFGVHTFPPVDPNNADIPIHYSQYQNEFGLISNCRNDSGPKAVLGKVCDERSMDVVDYRDTQDFAPIPEFGTFSWGKVAHAVDANGRPRRGYMFNSDEFADTGNVPAFTFDFGADPYEQIRYLESVYEDRYILDAFRRNRVMFDSWSVVERLMSRYLDTVQAISKTFAFASVLMGDSANFLDEGNYLPMSLGATVAFDMFARMLTRPEPGYYGSPAFFSSTNPVGVDQDIYVADWAPMPNDYLYGFHIALGDGRYLHNDYDYNQGYWWSDYQTQVGAYYEKIFAIYYLAEAYDSFISNSKEDFTDSRYKNVSFATVFPEQTRRLYNSLLTNDLDGFAPWVVVPKNPKDTPEAKFVYPTWHDLASPATRPANAKLADPNYAWNEQMFAMVWGTMFFTTNWSNAFVHDARITALPSERPDWPVGETLAFYNPETGMTYRAHAVGTETVLGKDQQKGAGARMLAWANKLQTLAYQVETDAAGKPIYNSDGTPQLKLDANGKPQLSSDLAAQTALRKYVDVIDIFRQLTTTFGQPLGDLGMK